VEEPLDAVPVIHDPDPLAGVVGVQDVIAWFGRMPAFHDADLRSLRLGSGGNCTLQIFAWNMTDQVDAQGYFVLDKYALVTVTLEGVTAVKLSDFDLLGVIFELKIERQGEQYKVAWSSSYGVEGELTARQISFAVKPETPRRRTT
jgi:hypothetical protein